ncbi:hypothetical protein ASG07_15525 [Sphingomonas sp. Leaf343]|nr:hypothetical protein ASG07_15525 [Sphingomonas sp. Leaf343]
MWRDGTAETDNPPVMPAVVLPIRRERHSAPRPEPASRSRLARMMLDALAALDEAATTADHGRVLPDIALRYAIALLYDCSDGDAAPYRAFWSAACDPGFRGTDRGRQARQAWCDIVRGLAGGLSMEVVVGVEQANRRLNRMHPSTMASRERRRART